MMMMMMTAYYLVCINVFYHSLLQIEADLLRQTAKVVSVGIGAGASLAELNNITSAPRSEHVIRVPNFDGLSNVEDTVRDVSCTG